MAFKKKKVEIDEEFDDDISNNDGFDDEEFDDEEFDDEDDPLLDESFDDFDTGIRNQADVVKIWLDTEPYLNNIYLSLTNQQIKRSKVKHSRRSFYKTDIVPISYKAKDKDGKEVLMTLKPLANNLGVSQIMAELKVFLSSPLVQGHLNNESYRIFMLWYEESITKMLWTNRIIWEIKINDVQPIYNKIVGSVGLFLTRPIGNLERGRDKWNPNGMSQSDDSGFIDKLAFWRKKKKNDAGGFT